MRLFVGVELDDAVRAAAGAAAEKLRSAFKRRRINLDARWSPPENLHVTIWFVGEVPDDRAAAIRGVLDQPFSEPRFDLSVAGCGAFPPSGPPRVIWFGLSAGVDPLKRLYAEVASRFSPLGLEPERRAYSPHLTIARVKDVPRGAVRDVRTVLADASPACGTCTIDAVTLFRSRTSPKGATYEPLLRVPLS